jgi:hypothetical protein
MFKPGGGENRCVFPRKGYLYHPEGAFPKKYQVKLAVIIT